MQLSKKNHIAIIIGTMLLLTLTLQTVTAENTYNLSSDMPNGMNSSFGNSSVTSVDTLKSTDSNINLETIENNEFQNNDAINNNTEINNIASNNINNNIDNNINKTINNIENIEKKENIENINNIENIEKIEKVENIGIKGVNDINEFGGNITVTKFANATVILNGDELTYIISVTNYGSEKVSGMIAWDVLDSSLIYLSSIPNKGNYNPKTGLWYIGDLASDETAILVINVRTNGSGLLKNKVMVELNDTAIFGGNGSLIIVSEIETQVLPAVKFSVTKTVNATKALNGGQLTYVVTVRNNGPDNATGVIVHEILDSRLILLSFIASKGIYDNTIWNIGDLAIGEIVTLTIYVKINGTGTIINNVTVETNENITGNNTAKVETDVLPAVNISINKTVNATTAIKGDELTYVITVTNNGPNNATSVNVTDKLDSRLIYLSSIASHGTYDASTGLWNIGELANGNTVTLKIVVRIDGKGIIPNSATVYTNETNTGNKTVKVETNVPGNVNLSISKTVNATKALVGEKLTYVITVTNNGPDDANSVNVVDKLDYRLIYLSSVAGAGNYNPSTGLWSIGNLKNGSSVNLTIVVWINGTGTIKNNGTVNTSDNNLGNNTFSMVETNVTAAVNISINKIVNATVATNGEELTYIITVANNGPNDASNINVTDILDSRLILISNTTTHGSYNLVTGLWNIGELANGKTATLKIIVRINGTGIIKNNATVYTDEINLGNISVEVETEVPGYVNISINKTVNATNALNGGELSYLITITNHGPDDASGMYVIDKLNKKLIFLSSSANIGTYDPITGVWNIGELAKGKTATLKIIVRINGTGIIENKATVYTTETNTGNNTSLVETEVEAVVNLSVSKTVNTTNALNGDELTYIITVYNNGPYEAFNVNATDLVDSKLIILSTNPSAGAYNPATGFWYIGYLVSGDTATLTITARINGTGIIQNNVTVNTVEKNLGNSFAKVETIVEDLVNISIKKTVNATGAFNGDELTYIITVKNNGPNDASNVNVTDILDSKLILISNVPNIGNYNPSTGLWTIGKLAKGEIVSLKLVVRINGTGIIQNNVTVYTVEKNIGNNNSNVETIVKALVNITINKTVNTTKVLNGEELEYIITVKNNGPDNAINVSVSDILDYSLVFLSCISDVGVYDRFTGIWTIGNLNKGDGATLTLYVRVNGTGTIQNIATLYTTEFNIGNNVTGVNVSAFEENINPNIINETNNNNTNIDNKTVIDLEDKKKDTKKLINNLNNNLNNKKMDNIIGDKNSSINSMKKTGMNIAIFVIILVLISTISYIGIRKINKKSV